MTQSIKSSFVALHNDQSGATATEYLILLILVACFCIAVVRTFGSTVSSKFGKATNAVATQVDFGGSP